MELWLAGIKIDVETPSLEQLRPYMEAYRPPADADQPPEFKVSVTQKDIDDYREVMENALKDGDRDIAEVSDLECEYAALFKKILERLIEYRIIYLHGSLLAVDGNGYLFMAPSGTGKSTHARLWRETYGDQVKMINDDKPLFKIAEDGSILACGDPWNGKHLLGCNESVPLKAIVKLRRGQENRIEELDQTSAVKLLYLGTLHFKEPHRMKLAMEVIGKIIENVKFYSLQCNMEPEAAMVSYERLVGSDS